jgi:hypothetical protein
MKTFVGRIVTLSDSAGRSVTVSNWGVAQSSRHQRIRWMKNPWDVVSGFKHDNRLKCHRGIVSQWTFQLGLNVTVDKTWVDVTSRHRSKSWSCACLRSFNENFV